MKICIRLIVYVRLTSHIPGADPWLDVYGTLRWESNGPAVRPYEQVLPLVTWKAATQAVWREHAAFRQDGQRQCPAEFELPHYTVTPSVGKDCHVLAYYQKIHTDIIFTFNETKSSCDTVEYI